ncbi:uncharacterized protein LDX57_010504 [Aspergillus melleus]|uniref:uncharacterized protein n=1 Tax=Aspergillus melleus TaxID=138277 RepID=UPI001E8E70F8|nr:uncharacterized protein LDX57_010504 [Aspergillus melleus]KAH8432872.1 hypothetical protein LDX57_010504 [Aspergillus melleus]
MSETTKNTRRSHWRGLNFAGTIDWAVDLQSFTDDDFQGPTGDAVKEPKAPPRPECKGTYNSIEAIQASLGSIPEECVPQYILEILHHNLTSALSRYDQLIAGTYNESFTIYAQAVVDSSGKQVDNFMQKHGNDYFTCVVTEEIACCSWCHSPWGPHDPVNCRYCEDFKCGWDPICDNPEVHCDIEYRYRNMTQPCPPDFSMRGQKQPAKGMRWTQSVYWTLRANKAAQFWADLYTETSIEQKNIGWRNEHHITSCSASDKHCADRNWDYNYPYPRGYDKEDVIDPKDVVAKARQNLTNLSPDLEKVIKDIKADHFLGNVDELVDALSLPISMISDAVDNMHKIVEIAEDIREEKSKAILLAFLSAIFFFIPIIGEVASAVQSLATIGRIVSLLGATGNAALDIYTLVDDKDNAPLAICGLILAPLALFDAVAVSKAANVRRGMSASDIKKLGEGTA